MHLAHGDTKHLAGAWLLLSELPHAASSGAEAPTSILPVVFDYARYYGLRIAAIFCDPNPPTGPGYEALVAADVILPISRTAEANLMAWWHGQGWDPDRLPVLRVVPLTGEIVGTPCVGASSIASENAGCPPPRWEEYARAILAELDAASPIPLLVVIEGTRAGGEARVAALETTSTRVRRQHWRENSEAILPGFRHSGNAAPGIGRGDLRGLWALLPLATVSGPAEAMRIQDETEGLGLKLAVAIEPGRPISEADLMLLARTDLALFACGPERDDAIDRALRTLPRTSTLRHRFRVATDAAGTLRAIAAERPRIAAGGMPQAPKRVFYWAGLTATQPFNTGIQRVTRSLGRALFELGIEVVPVKWDQAAGHMAPLDASEAAHLAQWGGPQVRAQSAIPNDLSNEWLLVPEVTVTGRAAWLECGETGAQLGDAAGSNLL